MHIGWIEDDSVIVETLDLSLDKYQIKDNFKFTIFKKFSEAMSELGKYNFSIIIVDLKNDQTNELDGKEIIEKIFEKQFCPIVVSTATSKEEISTEITNHPLVYYVQKGDGWDVQIIDVLKEIQEKTRFVYTVNETIRNINYKLLKSWYPSISEGMFSEDEKKRLCIRRFAASLDFYYHLNTSEVLHPCEMYLYPPIPESDLLTGDIIKKNDNTYYLLLSPSCDLVNCWKSEIGAKEQKPRIKSVLVARMHEKAKEPSYASKTTQNGITDLIEKTRKKEPESGIMVLPRLNDEVPGFVVDFKELNLVRLLDISSKKNSNTEYYRAASVDSPFREYISSCVAKYLGRMGLPEIDEKKWGELIWDVHEKNPKNSTTQNEK